MEKKGRRERRYQKKRDVKPIISVGLKDVIYRLNYITGIPVQDICPELCMLVLKDRKSIEDLSQYFKRDLIFSNTMFRGHETNKTIEKRIKGPSDRVSARFTQSEYASLALLTFALDCSVSRSAAVLLEISMSQVRFVNTYLKQYLQEELNESQMRELREILRYVNRVGESYYSWASLLSHVVDEVGTPVSRIKDVVSDFIDMKWRE
ncbi:hypothetical protein ACOMCU_25470 [Lysinibacillus sp. UGB7]|uniref:hypothetical protein n=1 Tax=Lysinibacillus sp. UGB7 TaxID=3411039 RepID=UPI003B7934DF